MLLHLPILRKNQGQRIYVIPENGLSQFDPPQQKTKEDCRQGSVRGTAAQYRPGARPGGVPRLPIQTRPTRLRRGRPPCQKVFVAQEREVGDAFGQKLIPIGSRWHQVSGVMVKGKIHAAILPVIMGVVATDLDLNLIPLYRVQGQELAQIPCLLAVWHPKHAARVRKDDHLLVYLSHSDNTRFPSAE
jgi:hypothetical protein